jgi:hypothetical protein
VERTSPSARAPGFAPRERRRVVIRRVALVTMLVCAFTLAMHARRLRARRIASSEGAHAAVVALRTAEPAFDRGPAVEPASVFTPHDVPPDVIRSRPTALAAGGASKERAAADALSNGAYPEALAIYQELAAENEANPAYALVIQILRTRIDVKSARSR